MSVTQKELPTDFNRKALIIFRDDESCIDACCFKFSRKAEPPKAPLHRPLTCMLIFSLHIESLLEEEMDINMT